MLCDASRLGRNDPGLLLEALEFANIVYKGREGIDMIIVYVTGPLLIPYFLLQFGIGDAGILQGIGGVLVP